MKQSVTCDQSMEPVPESDGRQLTWINNAGFDAGHYDMLMVRFKSKTVAGDFRMAFVCARELLVLGQLSAAVAVTGTDAVASSSPALDPVSADVRTIETVAPTSSPLLSASCTELKGLMNKVKENH